MNLLFGASSSIGLEYQKQSEKKLICVSRQQPPKSEFISNPNVKYIQASIEDFATNHSIIDGKYQNKIETIIFAHRYRKEPDDLSYDLKKSIMVEVDCPSIIVDRFRGKDSVLKNIIFLSSIASNYVADEQPDAYGMTKACVEKLASQLSVRLSKENISVNTLVLGYVKQSMKVERCDGFFNTGEYILPSNKVPNPSEIAHLIHGIEKLALTNRLFTGQRIMGDACLTMQTHSSVAEKARFAHLQKFKTHF